jgi:hypothetical protein
MKGQPTAAARDGVKPFAPTADAVQLPFGSARAIIATADRMQRMGTADRMQRMGNDLAGNGGRKLITLF